MKKTFGILLALALIAAMVSCAPAPVQYDLTISSSAGGLVTEPGEETFAYEEGTVVNLVAEAEEGYRFVNWAGDVGTVGDLKDAITAITISDSCSVMANFEEHNPVVHTRCNHDGQSGVGGPSGDDDRDVSGSYDTENTELIEAKWLGGDGEWTDADKWSTDVYPNNDSPEEGDRYRVIIDAEGDFTVTLNAEVAVDELEIDGPGAILRHTGDSLTLVDRADVRDGILELAGGRIRGGLVTSTGPGWLVTDGTSTLEGVTLNMDLTIGNGDTVNVESGLTLDDATVYIASTGSTTTLRFRGGDEQTLGGSGEVVFADEASTLSSLHLLELDDAGTVLTIGPGVTVRTGEAGGTISDPWGWLYPATELINQGRIVAGTEGLTLAVGADMASFTNEGVLEASGEGKLLVHRLDENTGEVAVTAGSVVEVGGDYPSGAELHIEVVCSSSVEYGTLLVDGAANLSGLLAVTVNGEEHLNASEIFLIISADSVSGVFDQVIVPKVGGEPLFGVVYQEYGVELVVGHVEPPLTYELTMEAEPEEGGIASDLTGESPYQEGAVVDIEAIPEEGYMFVEWTATSGEFDDHSAETNTFTMPGEAVTVTAHFEEITAIQYDLTVSSTDGGEVTSPGEATFTYDAGTVVDLVAEAEAGHRFVNWTGDVATILDAGAPITTITMMGHYSITANFAEEEAPPTTGCFIATAAYGTPMAEEIQILREFRDGYLLTNAVGQAFTDFYYRTSPPIAEFIIEHPGLKPVVRATLVPVVAMSTAVVNSTPPEKAAVVGLLVLASLMLAVWVMRRRGRDQAYN